MDLKDNRLLLGEETEASPSIWKHFVAHLNDVHAFGYNSTGSEQIWMKFGPLRVLYILAYKSKNLPPQNRGG